MSLLPVPLARRASAGGASAASTGSPGPYSLGPATVFDEANAAAAAPDDHDGSDHDAAESWRRLLVEGHRPWGAWASPASSCGGQVLRSWLRPAGAG